MSTNIEIPIKKLTKTAIIPTKAHPTDAGFDLYADTEFNQYIAPNTTMKVSTGISMAIPEGYFGGIYARSGLSTKFGLRPANCTGVIDSSYRGEIIVVLYNDSEFIRVIQKGDRIAQLIIQSIPEVNLVEVKELDETERNTGGFGSSGK